MEPQQRIIHPKMFKGQPVLFILLAILTITTLVAGVGFLIWYIVIKNEKMIIGSNEIRYEKGVLSKSYSHINIADIRNIRIEQGIIQRMTGAGKIGLSTSGQAGIEVSMNGVEHPRQLRRYILDIKKELEN